MSLSFNPATGSFQPYGYLPQPFYGLGNGPPVGFAGTSPLFSSLGFTSVVGALAAAAIGIGAAFGLAALSRSGTANTVQSQPFAAVPLGPPVTTQPQPLPQVGGPSHALVPQITGITNRSAPYEMVPRVYGKYRMYPSNGATPYSFTQNGEQIWSILLCLGPGPLNIQNVEIGQRPLAQYPAGTVLSEISAGTASDAPITLYTEDIQEDDFILPLASGQVQQRTAIGAADELSIDIQFPLGLYTVTTVVNTYKIPQPPGSPYGPGGALASLQPSVTTVTPNVQAAASVSFNVKYRLAGSSGAWTSVGAVSVSDLTSGSLTRTVKWTVPNGVYDIQVEKVTGDGDGTTTVNYCQWIASRAINFKSPMPSLKDQSGNPVYLAQIAMQVKPSSVVSGALQQIGCDVTSQLPAWNGSSWTAAADTQNPAWILADILKTDYARKCVSASSLDLAAFLDWANFCDASGFTFNKIYDQSVTVLDAVKEVTAAGRATWAIRDGVFTVIVDKPRDTVAQCFTPLNSSGFRFTKQFPYPVHALKVNFVNADTSYQQDTIVVYDDGYDASTATKFESLDLPGVTSHAQAWKLGRYHLACRRLRPYVYQFTTDVENLAVTRGDLISMTTDTMLWGAGAGRITDVILDASNNVLAVTLDNEIALDANKSYSVRIRSYFGDTVSAALTLGGTGRTLTFQTPLDPASAPHNGDLVLVFETGKEQLLLVSAIEPHEDLAALITAIDYSPDVYAADSGTIPDFVSNITQPVFQQKTLPAPSINNIRTDELVLFRDPDGSLQSRIQLVMDPPPASVKYFEARSRRTGSSLWGPVHDTPVTTGAVYITGVSDMLTYDVQVRSLDADGFTSDWVEADGILVIGKTTPPPVPVGINMLFDTKGNPTSVYWQYSETALGQPVPPDLAGFRVKYLQGAGVNWDGGHVAADLITATQWDMKNMPLGIVTVMVKAVDTSGNESSGNPAYIIRNLGDAPVENVIDTISSGPAYSDGTSTNGTVSGGIIAATDNGGLFYTADTGALMYSPVPSNDFYTITYLEMSFEKTFEPDADPPQQFSISLDTAITGESYKVEYMEHGTSCFYAQGPLASSTPFYNSDP